MKASLILRVLSLAAAAVGILIFLTVVDLPSTFLWRAISNFGHLPLFGLFSLLMFGLSENLLGGRIENRYWHYLIAVAATVMVGAVSEYTQITGPRDADLWDLIRDFGGAISFLCFYLIRDKRLAFQATERAGKIRAAAIGIAIAILMLGLYTPVYWALATWYRNNAFPVICQFESRWVSPFLDTKSAELALVASPESWLDVPENRVAKVTFQVATYSQISMEETYPDWSHSARFAFDIYSELDTAVSLALRIEDIHHNDHHEDRFNHRLRVFPGLNQISLDLLDIKNGPKYRALDMTAVRIFSIFVRQPSEPFTLYFDNFRLE